MKEETISIQDYLNDVEFETVNPKDFEYWLEEDANFQNLIQAAAENAARTFVAKINTQQKTAWAEENEE